jgi:CubicO group peptidase (beta-lactamase class C family)
MEKWKKRAVDLLCSIALGSDDNPSVVPQIPQKTEISEREAKTLVRSSPEKHGISSKRLYSMLCELEGEMRSNIHTILLLADGEVIMEASRDGYDGAIYHLSHSMSKTVTGMAIGLLIDDGILNTEMRLVDILPGYPYKDKRFEDITISHLLSMTAGVTFNEAGAVTETAWTESFFASAIKFNPGTKFLYNSMNSYILARIVTKVSGKSLIDLVKERIFKPLDIENYFWEMGPEGIYKGGWGLYLSAESWAKLGELIRTSGEYRGHRILSADWVKKSVKTRALAPREDGGFDYGYHIWCGKDSEEILFNGMLGQNVWIHPKNGLVCVILSGNNELFANSPSVEIVRKYLSPDMRDTLVGRDHRILKQKERTFFDSRRFVRPLERHRGILYWLGIRRERKFDRRFEDLIGSYAFAHNNAGILPLIVRAFNNNLGSSIRHIAFREGVDSLVMVVLDGGVEYKINIGFYEYAENIIDVCGDKFIVNAICDARVTAEGEPVYRIELCFPEMPNTRMIEIMRLDSRRISVELTELPNHKIIEALVEKATSGAILGFVNGLLERRFGEGFIERKLEQTFSPTLIGADEKYEGFEKIVEEEEIARREESRTVRMIRGVVNRFFKEDDTQEGDEPGEKGKSPLASLFGLFKK